MNKTTAIILGILAAIVIIFGVVRIEKNVRSEAINNESSIEQASSIAGCYEAIDNSKDVYSANIQSQNGNEVTGTLSFYNTEKDSSKGTFTGTYENGIVLGDYSFQSEGTTSVMQVAFKKSGDDFVRGYGDVNADGTRFTNVDALTYDATAPLSVFKKVPCNTPSTS